MNWQQLAAIADIQEEVPSLNRAVIEALWPKCFEAAKKDAEAELGRGAAVARLSWKEVFEKDYDLE